MDNWEVAKWQQDSQRTLILYIHKEYRELRVLQMALTVVAVYRRNGHENETVILSKNGTCDCCRAKERKLGYRPECDLEVDRAKKVCENFISRYIER